MVRPNFEPLISGSAAALSRPSVRRLSRSSRAMESIQASPSPSVGTHAFAPGFMCTRSRRHGARRQRAPRPHRAAAQLNYPHAVTQLVLSVATWLCRPPCRRLWEASQGDLDLCGSRPVRFSDPIPQNRKIVSREQGCADDPAILSAQAGGKGWDAPRPVL
jgi:hypothetical protein